MLILHWNIFCFKAGDREQIHLNNKNLNLKGGNGSATKTISHQSKLFR